VRFKPIRGNILYYGPNDSDNIIAEKILQDAQVSFTLVLYEKNKMTGFPHEKPLLVVNGRQYYGLEKIKYAAMFIASA
jgi:hypothetical protein